MTIDDLETALGISIVGTPQETRYQMLLDAAIDHVCQDCRRDFLDENGNLSLPAGVKMGVATLVKAMMENPGVQSQSLGDMSKSFFEGGTYKAARRYWKPYRKVGFV
jgi:hypothetical protein